MLFAEVTTIYFENHMKHINTLRGKMAGCINAVLYRVKLAIFTFTIQQFSLCLLATSNNNESTIKQNQLYKCKVFQCPHQTDKLHKRQHKWQPRWNDLQTVLQSDCNSLYLPSFNKCANDKLKKVLKLTCPYRGAYHIKWRTEFRHLCEFKTFFLTWLCDILYRSHPVVCQYNQYIYLRHTQQLLLKFTQLSVTSSMATCFGQPCDHHQTNFYRSCA